MRILLTNDDSVHAPGLWHAVDVLKDLGEVVVCAPDREQSGIGTAVTLHHPIRASEIPPYIPGITTLAIEGTPSDAVIVGLDALVEGPVDLVVSGINQGANLGRDVLISGTVAAALQAYFRGINAIAISVTALIDVPYHPAASLLRTVVSQAKEGAFAQPFLLNINLPKKPLEEIEGIEITHMAGTVYLDQVQESDDVRRPLYQISRSRPTPETVEGTDVAAIRANKASITPLRIAPTSEEHREDLEAVIGTLLESTKENALPLEAGLFWGAGRTRRIRPVRGAAARLRCNDLDETIAFYQRLGFEVDHEYKDKEGTRLEVTLRREAATFRCVQRDGLGDGEDHLPGLGVEVYVTVLNVERMVADLTQNGVLASEPDIQTTATGSREFVVSDPNGYRVVFGQPAPQG